MSALIQTLRHPKGVQELFFMNQKSVEVVAFSGHLTVVIRLIRQASVIRIYSKNNDNNDNNNNKTS